MNGIYFLSNMMTLVAKDDDAKNWDADELMDNLRKGTKKKRIKDSVVAKALSR